MFDELATQVGVCLSQYACTANGNDQDEFENMSDTMKGERVERFHKSKVQKMAEKRRKKQQNDNTGKNWFNMTAPQMTEELKNDLKILKMKGALDAKRHYKRDDASGLPKYFHVGTLESNSASFYSDPSTKKAKKTSLVDHLLNDMEKRKQRKKRYGRILAAKHRKLKKPKKGNKK
eukprot:m.32160 g.32160  ORF g.32160 m.32160 type:complete len:176 (+) comp9766_c0_seq1:70-597(+)